MIFYIFLYLLAILFLISGVCFFVTATKMCKRYVKQYDNVYADIDEANNTKGGNK